MTACRPHRGALLHAASTSLLPHCFQPATASPAAAPSAAATARLLPHTAAAALPHARPALADAHRLHFRCSPAAATHANATHADATHAAPATPAVATCTHAAPGLLPLLSSRHHQSRMHSCRIAQNNAIARRVRCVVNRAVIVYRVTSRRISTVISSDLEPDGFARSYTFIYRNHSSPRCYSLSYSLGVSYSLYPPLKVSNSQALSN